MQELIDSITRLSEEYYNLIKYDQHKDRECHGSVETKFSYGNALSDIVNHYSYLWGNKQEDLPTYKAALDYLKEHLETAIKEQKDYIQRYKEYYIH